MIDLHERLSEFSYGYGVTREAESLLRTVGVRTAPFLPSLLHEAQLGFDVGFKKPGAVLLIQFKLGQSLRRFVRRGASMAPAPILSRPFWRFKVDTAEPEGQYETLLKAEADGAEAYYAAPRFVDWSEYLQFFEGERVLENSVLVRPSVIRSALTKQGVDDGWHRIVYDLDRIYVCSEPVQIAEVNAAGLADAVRTRIQTRLQPLEETVHQVFVGLEHRHVVRRERETTPREAESIEDIFAPADASTARASRVASFGERARTEIDAIATALGVELWSLGIQMILASRDTPPSA
jgi:hypothetical protein